MSTFPPVFQLIYAALLFKTLWTKKFDTWKCELLQRKRRRLEGVNWITENVERFQILYDVFIRVDADLVLTLLNYLLN